MDASLLIRTADRTLRRKFGPDGVAANIEGLTAFADGLASKAMADPVTLTNSTFEGSGGAGQITMASEIWLHAAEELLADPNFNPASGAVMQAARVILPDYRLATAV